MLQFETWKIAIIGIILAIGGVFASANLLPEDDSWLGQRQISLGLDLQGGSSLLLQVEIDAVQEEKLENLAEAVRVEMRQAKIGVRDIISDNTIVSFTLRQQEQRQAAREVLKTMIGQDMIAEDTDSGFSLRYTEEGLLALARTTVSQAIEIVRGRIDETGTKEPIIQQQGRDRILLQLPGVDDPEQVKRLLGKTARLGFQLVDISATSADVSASGRIPPGSELLPSLDPDQPPVLVRKRVLISGDMLDDARPGFGQNNDPVVNFTLNANGAARFGKITGQNIGRPFAIVLDGKVVSAPVIRAQIFANGQISGNFTVTETDELALLLRAGALPAPLAVLEERSVGPGLGSDSIEAGKLASAVGLAAVIIFMLLSYGAFGMIATIALGVNVILLVGGLSVLQATLTLPGIAGIVLTMGMAVDANVLIFERIREQLKAGMQTAKAINAGFSQATSTIIDANLTTLFAAFCLYWLGSGPIKGFSVTLAFGVVTSMFSAVLVTRMLVVLWMRRRAAKPLVI